MTSGGLPQWRERVDAHGTELRNLERKAPKHALAEIRDDFHRIVYAAFERTFRFPKTQRNTLRTTNTIERLHEKFDA